jgi:hypothetical protein
MAAAPDVVVPQDVAFIDQANREVGTQREPALVLPVADILGRALNGVQLVPAAASLLIDRTEIVNLAHQNLPTPDPNQNNEEIIEE